VKKRGKRKATMRNISVMQLYQALATKIWIQGRQMEPKEVRQGKNSLYDAVAAAAQVFHDAGTDLCDQDLVRRIMNH
jgi:hypothetical protein